jgi:uncharacterized membrane-anchored protein
MGVVDLFAWHVDGHQRKVPELYWCSLCDIALNATVLAEHLDGSKPMGVVDLFAWHVDGQQRKVPELYWCSLCDIALNDMVLSEHLDFRLASTQQAERARSIRGSIPRDLA